MIWKPTYTHDDVKVIRKTLAHEGFFRVLECEFQFRLYEGDWSPILKRNLIEKQHAAAVLLYEPHSDQVVMVEQFRLGSLDAKRSPWVLEPVAGTLDPGDDADSTARREAEEEAGCQVIDLIPICSYLVSCGISNEQTSVYCGRIEKFESGTIHGLKHESEDIKVHAFSTEKAFALLASGDIYTASGVISLLWLQNHHQKLRREWMRVGQ